MSTIMPDRLDELLAGEAAGDLEPGESTELARARRDAAPDGELMRVAALAQLAFMRAEKQAGRALPARLEARLAAQASTWMSAEAGRAKVRTIGTAPRPQQAAVPAPAAGRRATATGRSGWYLAAGLALALGLSLFRPPATPPTQAGTAPLAQQREGLIGAPDAIRIPWGRSDQPGYASVTGDVVWSDSRQEGYLRLVGLPPNDPAQQQYQLWIVAPGRDRHPVDGGVFDVGSRGEVIVKIDAKLPVSLPAAFAVTLEKPGGVVVSTQPLLLVAAT
jgi:hypothetical protein